MFENKVKEDNKILISNLKARMFKGYNKVAKNFRCLSHKNKLRKFNSIFTLQNKEKENLEPYIKTYTNRFPTKINKELLPFENGYQDAYKKKYLNNYDNFFQLKDLHITNLSKNNSQVNNLKKKNIYLTESKNIRGFQKIINNIQNNEIDKSNQERTLRILFPYKEEINQFSNLPFFSLTKNPYSMKSQYIKKGEKNNNNVFLQEDFLYKISHKRENEQKFINNNFNKNKGVKKGKTIPLTEKNSEKKKIKLELEIQNMNENKQVFLNSKEKRYKILEKELQPLKNIVSLFSDLENNIMTVDENNNNLEKIKSENEKKFESIDKNLKTDIKQDFIRERNIDGFEQAYKTTYNFKKPKFYPLNYYSFNQLKRKEEKYENSHKLGFEEFQRKINLKEEKPGKIKRKVYELDEYEKQYFNKLFMKKEMTNKMAFMRDCRIRDIILTNKLKCEFSPSDIKRLLNGLKPWEDCQKLDKKFLMKKLPKSVDDFIININL